MFKKDQKPDNFKEVETIIGESVRVKGDFNGDGDIIIEGLVEGSVQTKGSLFIGEKSKISANISAKNIIINGEITGNINASEQLTIGSSAKITGDVECGKVAVESGAIVNGKISVSSTSKEGLQ